MEKFFSSVWVLVAAAMVIVAAGVGTGYFLSVHRSEVMGLSVSPGAKITGKTVGINDTKAFPDSARGVIQKGGLNGDGTHKLIRDGGPSQTVYLVSSVVDLNQLVDKKVEVWGQTVKAQKAPWLMDVGLVKILD